VESFGLGFAPLSADPVPARLLSLPEPDAAVVGLFCLSTALLPVLVLLPPAGVLAGLPLVPSSLEDWPEGFGCDALVLLQAKLTVNSPIVRPEISFLILLSKQSGFADIDGMDAQDDQDAKFLSGKSKGRIPLRMRPFERIAG
jgi:hypothetical protein